LIHTCLLKVRPRLETFPRQPPPAAHKATTRAERDKIKPDEKQNTRTKENDQKPKQKIRQNRVPNLRNGKR